MRKTAVRLGKYGVLKLTGDLSACAKILKLFAKKSHGILI